jgi:cytosine/adenosine deaminase-related metal-dependent hydrolase
VPDCQSLRARWVFPVAAPPIAGGVVRIVGGRIVGVGLSEPGEPVRDLGDAAILPGLVNAHAHLEYSELAAPLGREGMPFPDWIREVVAWKRTPGRDPTAAVRRGLAESLRHGVTTVGEIALPGWSPQPFADATRGPRARVFLELIGRTPEQVDALLLDADTHLATPATATWRPGLSPHASYSAHRDLLAGAVRLASQAGMALAMHLAESREESEWLQTGRGPMLGLLDELGVGNVPCFAAGTRPLELLRLLAEAPRALVVHGNYLDDEEVAFLGQRRDRLTAVYCPRTHAYFQHDRYPLEQLLAAGASVALGTDGRGSNPDLALLAEMRHVARTFPAVRWQQVLQLGTLAGSEALGLADDCGSLEPGKRADLAVVPIAVRTPADPHELLFDSDEPVAETYFQGRRVWPDQTTAG